MSSTAELDADSSGDVRGTANLAPPLRAANTADQTERAIIQIWFRLTKRIAVAAELAAGKPATRRALGGRVLQTEARVTVIRHALRETAA